MEELTLVKATEVFLVPTSIMIGAFGVASTEQLKTGLSVVCMIVAVMWGVCVRESFPAGRSPAAIVLASLPVLFLLVAAISTVVHGWAWYQERTKPRSDTRD
jgi:hypothetical protein